ncbi:MAG: sporulation integral membrane protein YtvI [Lachnospiraceae bacterium]|nr:sporulation integral membrane protein YtvI [Lachnospiraceae bacterium]
MKKQRPLWQACISLLFSVLATVAVILILYYGIIFLMPFLIGWIIATIAYPLVKWLKKRLNIARKFSSMVIIGLVIAIVVMLLYFGISFLVREIQSLLTDMPQLYSQAEVGFQQIAENLSGIHDRLPEGLQTAISSISTSVEDYLGGLINTISAPTVTAAGNFARNIPAVFVSILVAILASYFFIVEREAVIAFLQRFVPVSVKTRMVMVLDNLKKAVGGYIKAQLQIMVVVFVILLIGLAIGQVNFFAIFALLIALLDVLPVLGTGTVMVPWALYALLTGDIRLGIILLVTWVLTNVAHHLLQPKLVSGNIGIHPVVALLLIYLGYRFGGLGGMIFAIPLGMIVINLVKAGAFAYITDDVKLIVERILSLRGEERPLQIEEKEEIEKEEKKKQ